MPVDRKTWLFQLASAYGKKLDGTEILEYDELLRHWQLTDEQWAEVKLMAKRRSKFFPVPSELEELQLEVRTTAAAARPKGRVWDTFTGEDGLSYARRPGAKA